MTEEKPKLGAREKSWVESLVKPLAESLGSNTSLEVRTSYRLPYRYEIHCYEGGSLTPVKHKIAGYQTDLLILERISGGWIPRVVIECKIGNVTTHDALTYSAKAATHRHVHPYLRYGILIGEMSCVPSRIIHHGTQFDFMAAWPAAKASAAEWTAFVGVLKDEVDASRVLQQLMERHSHTLIHRPLVLLLAKTSTQKPSRQQA
ncbi:MAG TPA: hypothetical protein VFW23_04835 [Tepidisphaeraceae bacterium]|nr:hypothetical protein [Tepidisphaeraceae bacterium]